MIKKKQCPKCEKWKSVNRRFGYCRECKLSLNRIYNRKYREKNIEKNPDWKKDENKKLCNRNLRAQFIKKYFKKYPERLKAKIAVQRAKKSGKLKKGKCVVCGEIRVIAHHPNYQYPLKVVWLCQKHHKQLHAKIIKL